MNIVTDVAPLQHMKWSEPYNTNNGDDNRISRGSDGAQNTKGKISPPTTEADNNAAILELGYLIKLDSGVVGSHKYPLGIPWENLPPMVSLGRTWAVQAAPQTPYS